MRWILLNMPFALFVVALVGALAAMWVVQGRRREAVPAAVVFAEERSSSARR